MDAIHPTSKLVGFLAWLAKSNMFKYALLRSLSHDVGSLRGKCKKERNRIVQEYSEKVLGVKVKT